MSCIMCEQFYTLSYKSFIGCTLSKYQNTVACYFFNLSQKTEIVTPWLNHIGHTI